MNPNLLSSVGNLAGSMLAALDVTGDANARRQFVEKMLTDLIVQIQNSKIDGFKKLDHVNHLQSGIERTYAVLNALLSLSDTPRHRSWNGALKRESLLAFVAGWTRRADDETQEASARLIELEEGCK